MSMRLTQYARDWKPLISSIWRDYDAQQIGGFFYRLNEILYKVISIDSQDGRTQPGKTARANVSSTVSKVHNSRNVVLFVVLHSRSSLSHFCIMRNKSSHNTVCLNYSGYRVTKLESATKHAVLRV